jgi:uncharacterized protein (DUF983 family)
MKSTVGHALRMFGRALSLRCPNCGGRPIFRSWFRMRPYCPVCGIPLERGESGYQVGSYMFNIVASELSFATLFVLVLVVTWSDSPRLSF